MARAEAMGLHKVFKLETSISITNMHLFSKGCMKKYTNALEIINEFYEIRKDYYILRKEYQLKKFEDDLDKLNTITKFIKLVASNQLIIVNKMKDTLLTELEKLGFKQRNGSYDYLLSTPLWNLTQEKN